MRTVNSRMGEASLGVSKLQRVLKASCGSQAFRRSHSSIQVLCRGRNLKERRREAAGIRCVSNSAAVGTHRRMPQPSTWCPLLVGIYPRGSRKVSAAESAGSGPSVVLGGGCAGRGPGRNSRCAQVCCLGKRKLKLCFPYLSMRGKAQVLLGTGGSWVCAGTKAPGCAWLWRVPPPPAVSLSLGNPDSSAVSTRLPRVPDWVPLCPHLQRPPLRWPPRRIGLFFTSSPRSPWERGWWRWKGGEWTGACCQSPPVSVSSHPRQHAES